MDETSIPHMGKRKSALFFRATRLCLRKIYYTINAIESLNSSFRKISRHRNLFPTIDSPFKLFYLSLRNISARWTLSVANWPSALSYFAIEFANRMPSNH